MSRPTLALAAAATLTLTGTLTASVAATAGPWTPPVRPVRIVEGFDRHPYRRLYDNVAGRLADDAAAIVRFSADRYLAWIGGEHDDLI